MHTSIPLCCTVVKLSAANVLPIKQMQQRQRHAVGHAHSRQHAAQIPQALLRTSGLPAAFLSTTLRRSMSSSWYSSSMYSFTAWLALCASRSRICGNACV